MTGFFRLSLAARLSMVFSLLLLASSAISAALQIQANTRHGQALAQQLSAGLAGHIARTAQLMDRDGWRPDAVRLLFDRLMMVNPSVEVYLLDNDGRIVGNAAPPGHLKRSQVDLAPVRRLLAGADLPVVGDDPRNPAMAKVFSAAPVMMDGHQAGYVYVILEGEDRDALSARLANDAVLRTTLLTTAMVALLGLGMGLLAFRLITRPLRDLTEAVGHFDPHGEMAAAMAPPSPPPPGDDIAQLRAAFARMGQRIGDQWRDLTRQDQDRRDLIANLSHDLRTPLTSLHLYLETLRLKEDSLSDDDRRHYLDRALDQSAKVGRLAQQLFDLARLESGLVQPEIEAFSLPDLLQDVVQKFELALDNRRQTLGVDMPASLPLLHADLGMTERVLTNLIGNAARHTPDGSHIVITLRSTDDRAIIVDVADTGPGIPPALRPSLFTRAATLTNGDAHAGGLGLVVVHRLLALHGATIQLVDQPGWGTVFRLRFPPG